MITISPPSVFDKKHLTHEKVDASEYIRTGATPEWTVGNLELGGKKLGNNGYVNYEGSGFTSGNNGNKTIRLKFGSTLLATIVAPASPSMTQWCFKVIGFNLGVENNQKWIVHCWDGVTLEEMLGYKTTSENTAYPRNFVISVELENAGDTVAVQTQRIMYKGS